MRHAREPRSAAAGRGRGQAAPGVDGRALCGRAIEDADVYEDDAGLPAWNDGPLERCGKCTGALLARIRRAPRPAGT